MPDLTEEELMKLREWSLRTTMKSAIKRLIDEVRRRRKSDTSTAQPSGKKHELELTEEVGMKEK